MKRKGLHTAWAATFGVAAELSRHGHDVAFTMGNTERVDLLGVAPDGTTYRVQVKGISKPTAFRIRKLFFEGPAKRDLFLTIVLVAPIGQKPNLRFFILNHRQAKREFARLRTHRRDGRVYGPRETGMNWGSIKGYENRWSAFPGI